jgi:hypothetical protein
MRRRSTTQFQQHGGINTYAYVAETPLLYIVSHRERLPRRHHGQRRTSPDRAVTHVGDSVGIRRRNRVCLKHRNNVEFPLSRLDDTGSPG